MLKASLAAAGVVDAQSMCSASRPASVMSVRPFHWVSDPGKTNGSPAVPAEGGLRGEGEAHVHGVAHRVADHGVGTVHGPGEPLLAPPPPTVRPPGRSRSCAPAAAAPPRGRACPAFPRRRRPRTGPDSASARSSGQRGPRACPAAPRAGHAPCAALTAMFSSSVSRRDHAVKKTCEGFSGASTAASAEAEVRSAESHRTPGRSAPGRRDRARTAQPSPSQGIHEGGAGDSGGPHHQGRPSVARCCS